MVVAKGKIIMAGIVHVPLPNIDPNPYQPRAWPREEVEKLARSIEQNGLAQVPTGRRAGERIQIGAGHGRVEAYRLLLEEGKAGFAAIPINIQDLDDEAMAIMALVENLERRELTPMDTARACRRILEAFPSWTQTALAPKLGMSQPNLSNMIRVLAMPADILTRVDAGELAWTVARDLLPLEGFDDMIRETLELAAEWGSLSRQRVGDAMLQTVTKKWRRLFSTQQHYDEAGNPQFDYKRVCHKCEHLCCVPLVDRFIEPGKKGEEYREFCSDPQCWDRLNQEAIGKRDAAARQRAERSVRRSIQPKVESQGISRGMGIVQADLPAAAREPVTAKDRELEGVATEPEQPAASEPVSEIPERLRPISIQEAGKIAHGNGKSQLSGPDAIAEYFLRDIDHPEECTTTCTKGFHIVYDPQRPKTEPRQMCCNPKCHRGKKAIFSRNRNRVNDSKIEAEKKGIAQVVGAFKGTLGAIELRLVLRALHFHHYGYSGQAMLAITNDRATKALLKELGVDVKDYTGADVCYRQFVEAVATATEGWLAKKILEAALENLKAHGDRTNWVGWITDDLAALGVDVSALRGEGL